MLITFKSPAAPDVRMLSDLRSICWGLSASGLASAVCLHAENSPEPSTGWRPRSMQTRSCAPNTRRVASCMLPVRERRRAAYRSGPTRFWTCCVRRVSTMPTFFGAFEWVGEWVDE